MIHLAFNGSTVALILFFIVLTIVVCIIVLRYYWKYKLTNSISHTKSRPLKNTGGLHAFGICMALLTTITLISWTQSERAAYSYHPRSEIEDEIMNIPPTIQLERKSKPLPPAPPPNPIIQEVEDLVEIEKIIEIPLELPIDKTLAEAKEGHIDLPIPDAPMPLPPAKINNEKEYVIVERMPRFPGCESEDLTLDEKYECSEKQLLQFIAKNLKYPSIAKVNNIEGKVFVEFVVTKKGDVTGIKVLRDIGAGCGAAAQQVISTMVKENGLWKPGMQDGRKVKVKYTVPITFKLAK